MNDINGLKQQIEDKQKLIDEERYKFDNFVRAGERLKARQVNEEIVYLNKELKELKEKLQKTKGEI